MNNKGYRGYIGTRPYNGINMPQAVQNFLIRNYCQKNNLTFLLSGTEYSMQGCYMILEEILSTIHLLDGIVVLSIFMLPESPIKRQRIYDIISKSGKKLFAALEDLSINTVAEIEKVENILKLNKIALKKHSIEALRAFVSPKLSYSFAPYKTSLSGTT